MLTAEKQERLLSRLRSADEAVRVHAALRLTADDVDAAAVRPALEQARHDAEPHVCRLAEWVLQRLDAARAA